MTGLDRTLAVLAELIAFPTVSSQSNLALIGRVEELLAGAGFAVTRIAAAEDGKAGLLARFGTGEGGVLWSAHSDVVPVAGQDWTLPPFEVTRQGGRLHGRGTTDMKGFLACVLAFAETLRERPPARPMMIALSWDEEVGVRGIREMIGAVIPVLGRPELCIVGEPTLMRPAIGHKGKASYRAICRGEAGHSALAPKFTNALHLAADLIGALRAEQARLAVEGAQDRDQDPGYSTVHAGVMAGGVALNIVPDRAEVQFEIRHLAAETPESILARIGASLPAGIEVSETGAYPGLASDPADPALAECIARMDDPRPVKIAFGTEAGYFAGLGIPTLVCGPGTMADGHQPDESIAEDELQRCLAFIGRMMSA